MGEHDGDKRSNGRSDGLLGEGVGTFMVEWAYVGSVLYLATCAIARGGNLLATRAIESRWALTII